MAYENETQEEILSRMLQRVDSSIDKREGSIVFDMMSPASIELALAYIELDNILNFGFADTTYGEYLDKRVKEVGLSRKEAVKAFGKVTISGTVGTVVPAGTQLSTEDEENPILFETLNTITIVEEKGYEVDVSAVEGGASGNVNTGLITTVLGELSGGIISVTNEQPLDGGIDSESDEDLLIRYYDRMRNRSAAGSVTEYRSWALEAHQNISDARIFERWDGPGTLKIVLLATNRRPPSQAIVEAVKDYIEERRPIGVELSVVGAKEIPIDVRVKLTLTNSGTIENALAQIENNVTNYLKSLAFVDQVVRYTKIADCVLNAEDVLDYENLTVNLGTSNIQIADDEVAVLGKAYNI